jgi:hypothetical protein
MMKHSINKKKQEIKQLIEELNYRTERRTIDELVDLSQKLHALCIELKVMEELSDSITTEVQAQEVTASVVEETAVEPTAMPSEAIIEEIRTLSKEEKEVEHHLNPPTRAEKTAEDTSEETNDELDSDESLADSTIKSDDLNKRLSKRIVVDFNDRFAFVNKLFDGNQEDFNSVVSQLNTMSSFKEAVNFIENIVKPDYNWKDKEEYEERFLALIERHLSE